MRSSTVAESRRFGPSLLAGLAGQDFNARQDDVKAKPKVRVEILLPQAPEDAAHRGELVGRAGTELGEDLLVVIRWLKRAGSLGQCEPVHVVDDKISRPHDR